MNSFLLCSLGSFLTLLYIYASLLQIFWILWKNLWGERLCSVSLSGYRAMVRSALYYIEICIACRCIYDAFGIYCLFNTHSVHLSVYVYMCLCAVAIVDCKDLLWDANHAAMNSKRIRSVWQKKCCRPFFCCFVEALWNFIVLVLCCYKYFYLYIFSIRFFCWCNLCNVFFIESCIYGTYV